MKSGVQRSLKQGEKIMSNNDTSNLGSYEDLMGQVSLLRSELIDKNQGLFLQKPFLADLLNERIRDTLKLIEDSNRENLSSADSDLLALAGLGENQSTDMSRARIPARLPGYEDDVASERLLAIADLYYIYQHERIGVFNAVLKLQELFKSGRVRLASGPGAMMLYQYDRQKVLRYTKSERFQAYRRVFGYTDSQLNSGAKPNSSFHGLFMNFNTLVAQFFRDQRVSEVIRPDGSNLAFGSMAVVRRAGLDLRNNLKHNSYGHINVLRIEVFQLLEKAFEILGADDIKHLYGADSAWDVLEEILNRHLNHKVPVSQRSRMAVTGHEILTWLSQADILAQSRADFEPRIGYIKDAVEEWITSAESLGMLKQEVNKSSNKVVSFPMRSAMVAQ